MSRKVLLLGLGCAFTALGVSFWHSQARGKPNVEEVALRAELAQLKRDLRSVKDSHRVSLLALGERAQASPVEAAARVDSPEVTEPPIVPSEPLKIPEEVAAEQERRAREAVHEAGDRLDAFMTSEAVDVAYRRQTDEAARAVFAALPGGKVLSTECGSQLCRVDAESSSESELLEVARQLAGKPPFDQEVLYRYDTEAQPPKLSLYVGRAGVQLASLLTE